ncbi:MAG: hypothetical protein ACOCZ9_00550 [Spirochaetota bacterium]
MNVSSITRGFVKIERDGKEFLGVETGIRGGSFAVRKLSHGTNLNGWIIRGDHCSRWDTAGLTQHEGLVYVYGPYMEMQPLRDLLLAGESEALAALERVAHALRIAEQEGVAPQILHTRGVLLLEDGGVALLPHMLVEALRDQQDDATRLVEYELFNHPDRRGLENLSFALASASYAVLTGSRPYQTDDATELHTMIREQTVLEPVLIRPELLPEVSDFLFRCLNLDMVPDLEQWPATLHDWRDSGVTRDIDEQEYARLRQQAEQKGKQLVQQYSRNEKVRKYWKQVAVAVIALALIGTIPGSIIRGHLEPRKTAGMEAQEVVRAFYTAQNELDHETMDDATIDGAGSGPVREVTNLFVISRMRMSVEFDSGVVNAAEWDEQGRPPIPEGSWIYGVTGLEIEETEADSGDEKTFRVDYTRWRPDNTPEDTDVVEPEDDLTEHSDVSGVEREELVRVRKDEDDWVIYDIETLDTSPVEFELEFEESGDESSPAPDL